MKIAWENVLDPEDAEIVVLGCTNEEGSAFEGAAKGPDAIRKASNEWLTGEYSDSMPFQYSPQWNSVKKKVFDHGNVLKSELFDFVQNITASKRIPFVLGGDHSITTEILKAFNEEHKNISIVYLDAHPDFTSRETGYYASVLAEANEFENIKLNKSVLVGVRAATYHELENIKKSKLKTFYSVDFVDKGVKKIFSEIKKHIGKKFYLSIDVDILDSAFAPGVSDPVPGGISSNELFWLCKKLAELKPVGVDLVEVIPDNDVRDKTSMLAAKLVSEIIASFK